MQPPPAPRGAGPPNSPTRSRQRQSLDRARALHRLVESDAFGTGHSAQARSEAKPGCVCWVTGARGGAGVDSAFSVRMLLFWQFYFARV